MEFIGKNPSGGHAYKARQKILLAHMPHWDPLIPPMGIACLKAFLGAHGYEVKTVDANTETRFRDLYFDYLETLKESVPVENRGNFYNSGPHVVRNHLMAHLHYTDKKEYDELLKQIIFFHFFYQVEDRCIDELEGIVGEFFLRLEQYIACWLEEEQPQVLGLSVYSGTLPASLFAFKLAKKLNPGILTVMGGGVFSDQLAYDSPNLKFFLEKTPFIDKIIIGEGEQLFLQLLQGDLPEAQRVYTLKDIGGKVLDLSQAGLPDFSDFDIPGYPYLAAYASRGCPYRCGFCSESQHGGKYRVKNAKQITAELTTLYHTYNTRIFLMGDSLLNPLITGLAREFIDREVSMYWDGYLRVDPQVCDPEYPILWRQGGFYRARMGIESGSQRMLDRMDKRITLDQIKHALANLAYAGIKTTTYWVIGYPGETETDFQMTLDLISELKDVIYEAECNPFTYYFSGQNQSPEWTAARKTSLLYPETANSMLIVPTWVLNLYPPRREIYGRMSRFLEHCRRLGIPNPHFLHEIYLADERWKKLHKNAAPSLVEYRNMPATVNECKEIKTTIPAKNTLEIDDNFNF